jgi:hypothetical protein
MAGKTNTDRIEVLEDLTSNLAARLDVHDVHIKGLSDLFTKGTETTANHSSKIVVIEERLLVLADFKNCIAAVTVVEKDIVAIKKDLESLRGWKDDLKKERDESSRRLWAFGPNLLAAFISGLISLGTALLVLWLNKPK